MPPFRPDPDDDVELCPVPLGREARALLVAMARETGERELDLAAALIVACLKEDALAHAGVKDLPATLN